MGRPVFGTHDEGSHILKAYTNTRRAFRRRLLRTLQPCQEVVPLMSESLERRLSGVEYLKLSLHLWVCDWCKNYLKQIKFLSSLLRQRTLTAANDKASRVALTVEARQRIVESDRRRDLGDR